MSFCAGGKQHRRSTGTGDKKLAEKIYAKVLTLVAEGKWFEVDTASKYTFDELMSRYIEYSKIHHRGRTVKNVITYSKHLLQYFSGYTLNQITAEMISQYRDKRLSEGKAAQTVLHELYCLSSAFNLAIKEWGWCKENPCQKVKKPRVKNEIIRYLTEDEESKLLKACSSELLRDIVVVALDTGLRQTEILELKFDNVDLEEGVIVVKQSKTLESKAIPMTDRVYEVLKRRLSGKTVGINKYVFATSKGTRILNSNLQREFRKALKKAGIKDFRFHDLRHTFASRLVQQGVDIYTVAKLLGHKDISTTQRYSHLNIQAAKTALLKLRVKNF